MIIDKSIVNKLLISDGNMIVNAYLEDFEIGKGKLIVEHDCDAWSYYWGNMGKQTLKEFISSASTGYLVKKLKIGIDDVVTDESAEALSNHAMKWIIQERRSGEITREQAREAWSEAESIMDDGVARNESYLESIFGDCWYDFLPTKQNEEYNRLYRIVEIVKSALKN